jgi:hypothetical protein
LIERAYVFTNRLTLHGLIPSTPSVGYGITAASPYFDPFLAQANGRLMGDYSILPEFQSTTLDVAYLVTDSLITFAGLAYTTGFPAGETFAANVYVPEPTSVVGLIAAAALLARRRVRRAEIQQLETRQMLTLGTPLGVVANFNPQTLEAA